MVFAILSPAKIALFSDSLLVVGNWSWTPYLKVSPSSEVMMTPTPPIFFTDDRFVYIVHNSDMFAAFSFGKVNLAIKLANTWAFMAVRGLYSMSNWLNSIAHCTIQLAASSLLITFLIGWSIMTRIGFAWK